MSTSKTFVHLQWNNLESGQPEKLNDFVPITIGRDPGNTVGLPDSRVSLHHAYITTKDEKVVIVDNKSLNGIFANGKRVKQHIISNGDTVQIGPYTLQIEYEAVKMRPGVRHVQCSNPQCRRIVPQAAFDCPWCGYNLGNSDTVPTVS